MAQLTDRRVHAENGQWQLVRYDRSSKWYMEPKPRNRESRRGPLTIERAVQFALEIKSVRGGRLHLGVIGGQRFDAMVRAELDE